MFEVGFTEIVLILGIALLVLGPERLPKLVADVGRWAGRARAMARQLRTQLEQEAIPDPLGDPLRPTPQRAPVSPMTASAATAASATAAAAHDPAQVDPDTIHRDTPSTLGDESPTSDPPATAPAEDDDAARSK
jgi:sec-independent protein translocase protein TatB